MAMRPLFRLLCPAGPRARLSILIFHRVLPQADPLLPDEMHAARFDALCGWVRRWFNVLPLDHAARRLQEGTLPARAMAITFDDGYADNHDVALPLLRAHGLTATFFVATGFLDGGRMWNDTLVEAVRAARCEELELPDGAVPGLGSLPLRTVEQRRTAIDSLIRACRYMDPPDRLAATGRVARAARARLPDDLMMRSDQVRALHAAGMAIGGHTATHPILARLDARGAADEIRSGKAHLESLLDAEITTFAYPNGRPDEDYRTEHVAMVRAAGFRTAVSTSWGAAVAQDDPYQLPRFTPWDLSQLRFGVRLASNMFRRGRSARN